MPTNTWIAASAGLASEPTNWSLGRAPITGDTVVFDATSVNNCSWDLDGLTIVPDSEALATGYSGTVALASDMMSGAGGLVVQAGVLNGGGKWVKSQGNVRHTGGTLSTSTPHIEMQGNGTTLQLSANDKIGQLKFTGQNINFQAPAGGCEVDAAFTNNGSVNLSGLFHLPPHLLSSSTVGNISGTGKLSFRFYNTNATIPAMNISCNLVIWSLGIATQNNVATMGGALTCKDLEIYSSHATYTITLNHGSNHPLTVTGAMTLGARAIMNQGTAQWSFNGGYTQNGASSVFNMGGPVSSGNVAISDGTLTGRATATWTYEGNIAVTGSPTITPSVLNMIMTGDGKTVSGAMTVRSLKVSGNTTIAGGMLVDWAGLSLVVDAGKNLHFANGGYIDLRVYVGTSINIAGTTSAAGTGKLIINLRASGLTADLHNFGAALEIRARSNVDGNYSVTASALVKCGTLIVASDHASYTVTLDTAGFALSHRGLTVGVRGAVKLNASKVLSFGNTDTSAGSLDADTSQYVQAAPGTIKTASGQKLKHLVTLPSASLKLLSALTVSGRLIKGADNIDLNGNALTHESPEELYDRCRVVLDTELAGGSSPYGPEMYALEDLVEMGGF